MFINMYKSMQILATAKEQMSNFLSGLIEYSDA